MVAALVGIVAFRQDRERSLTRIFHPNRIKDVLRDSLTPCKIGVKYRPLPPKQ